MTSSGIVDLVVCRVCRQMVKRPRELKRKVWDCPACGSAVTDRKIVQARAPIVKRVAGQRMDLVPAVLRLAGGIGVLVVLAVVLVSRLHESVEDNGKRICQERVKEQLTSPASAHFSDVRVLVHRRDFMSVLLNADSQNAYAAMVRSRWACTFQVKGHNLLVTGVDQDS